MYISSIDVDLNNSKTSLCELGVKYGTNKCPFLDIDPIGDLQRDCNSYTPLYDLLFFSLKHKQINFGEIGIYKNASMKMWREYFSNANLYGWDCHPEDADEYRYQVIDFIAEAKKDNLENTLYDYMNVRDENSILDALERTNCKFDVLLDDSDHEIWSQIKIIRNAPKYLNPGGLLVIEDINYTVIPEYSFDSYINQVRMHGHDKFYDSIVKINTHHIMEADTHPNNCILVLTRNNFDQ